MDEVHFPHFSPAINAQSGFVQGCDVATRISRVDGVGNESGDECGAMETRQTSNVAHHDKPSKGLEGGLKATIIQKFAILL